MKRGAMKLPIRISKPDKLFWPEEGYTKLDLIEFYAEIFPKLRPYVNDRILTMERCPDGMLGECFYQKEKPKGMPPDIPTKRIRNVAGSREWTTYVVGGSLKTQLALANLGCIAVHVCGSRAKTFPKPDWMCIDIDPSSGEFRDAAPQAIRVKNALETLGLVSFAKTSGSRGLHVFVPLRLGPTAGEVLRFAEQLVNRIAAAYPEELTVEHSIAARGNRVYLDPFRNGSVQTVVAPYSVRRRPRAPVSTPLRWSEVSPSLEPSTFNMESMRDRIKKADPWADFFRSRQTLKSAWNKLASI
jgi:bifunctional non-homologous end joining protein LigD